MLFPSEHPRTLLLVLVLLTSGASAQRGAGSAGVGPSMPIPTPSAQFPSDSSMSSQGGLLVTVVGENRVPLDRQALVKAINKDTQNVIWQTTGRDSEAGLGALEAGTYQIEVSPVGYLTTTLDVKLSSANVVYRVHVDLKKDPTAIDLNVSSRQEMPAKARREMSQGVAALKSGKLKQAQKHLVAANDLFPSNAELKFLLGYLFFQEKDFKQAETYLVEVSTFDSHNVQALTLLGRLQIQRQDYAAARKTMEQAIAVDPEYWMAHSLLADTYLKQQEYEKAREQAQLAIDKGKGAANSALIALGEA